MALLRSPWRALPGMDALTQTDPLIAEVQTIETDALYTGQSNFIRARWFGTLRLALGIPAALAGALAAATLVAEKSPAVAGAFAVAASVLAALHTFLNPDGRANEHTQQGNAYKALQTDARILRTIDYARLDDASRRERLKVLVRRRNELNARNRPDERSFKKAQKKIESGDLAYDDSDVAP